MNQLIGYARVSTREQNMDLQEDELKKAGCSKVFVEHVSGAKENRIELQRALEYLRPGDTLMVWKLDRLGRSLLDLIQIVNGLKERGIHFKSTTDDFLDTSTPSGQLVFTLFAALAEYERNLIRERTKAGLEAARARGRKGGRPKGLSEAAKQKARIAAALYRERIPVDEICAQLQIARATLYSYLRYMGVEIGT